MPEILALTRLSIARSRTAIQLAILYFVILQIVIAVYSYTGFEGDVDGSAARVQAVSVLATVMSLPLLGITFGLFDFSEYADVNSAATGYMPWLLRTPIKSWKLAAVPIALKTLWVLAICSAIAGTTAAFGVPLERWFVPAIGIASLFVLACLVTWHPFHWAHSRLVLVGLLFVPAYAWLIMSISFAFANEKSDMPSDAFSVTVTSMIGISTFFILTGLSLRSVRLARVNVLGQIKESRHWFAAKESVGSRTSASPTTIPAYKHAATVSPLTALFRYDLAKLSGGGTKVVFASWCLIVLFWSVTSYARVDCVIGLVVMLMFPAMFLNEWMISSRDGKFLPNLIAVAPVPSSTFAWTRQCLTTAIWFASLSGVPIVMAIWHFNGASREGFDGWNQIVHMQYGVPGSGWRMGLVVSIIALILVVRHTTWNAMANATDNKRFCAWSLIVKFGIVFTILVYYLFRFMKFPSWDAWGEAAWKQIAELPGYLPWLLVAKLTIVAIASVILYRSGLTRAKTVIGLFAGYAMITLLCSTAVWKLIPSDKVYLWHCIAMFAVLVPYSRIAMAPLCLARNRHR